MYSISSLSASVCDCVCIHMYTNEENGKIQRPECKAQCVVVQTFQKLRTLEH